DRRSTPLLAEAEQLVVEIFGGLAREPRVVLVLAHGLALLAVADRAGDQPLLERVRDRGGLRRRGLGDGGTCSQKSCEHETVASSHLLPSLSNVSWRCAPRLLSDRERIPGRRRRRDRNLRHLE